MSDTQNLLQWASYQVKNESSFEPYLTTGAHTGYVPLGIHNAQNMPSAVPDDDHGRCDCGENLTNYVITFTIMLASKWDYKTAVVSVWNVASVVKYELLQADK